MDPNCFRKKDAGQWSGSECSADHKLVGDSLRIRFTRKIQMVFDEMPEYVYVRNKFYYG